MGGAAVGGDPEIDEDISGDFSAAGVFAELGLDAEEEDGGSDAAADAPWSAAGVAAGAGTEAGAMA